MMLISFRRRTWMTDVAGSVVLAFRALRLGRLLGRERVVIIVSSFFFFFFFFFFSPFIPLTRLPCCPPRDSGEGIESKEPGSNSIFLFSNQERMARRRGRFAFAAALALFLVAASISIERSDALFEDQAGKPGLVVGLLFPVDVLSRWCLRCSFCLPVLPFPFVVAKQGSTTGSMRWQAVSCAKS